MSLHISPLPNVLKWIWFIRDPYSQSFSRPRRIQSCMDDWNNSNSHPLDEWGFTQPQNLSKNSHMILLCTLIFTCVLITSHPLKTFRITHNFCMEWNGTFVRHLWWYSIFQERITGPVFMLLTTSTLHFVKNCIQGPFAENVTALIKIRHFSKGLLPPLAEKMSTSCCLLPGKT